MLVFIIDISNLSFGCVANASGTCITLPTTVAGQPKGIDYNNYISNQNQLKDFVLRGIQFLETM